MKITLPNGQTEERKLPGDHTTEDCWFEVGLGMAGTFYDWLGPDAAPPEKKDLVVARVVDGREEGPAVGLQSAWVSAVGLTRVEPTAEDGAAFLRARVTFDDTEFVDPHAFDPGAMEEEPFDVSTLDVDVNGVDVDVTLTRNLLRSVEVIEQKVSLPNGRVEIVKTPGKPDVAPLVLGSATPDGAARLRDWYADIDDGSGGIRTLRLTLSTFGRSGQVVIEGDRAWPPVAETFPRADGHTRATLAIDELSFTFER